MTPGCPGSGAVPHSGAAHAPEVERQDLQVRSRSTLTIPKGDSARQIGKSVNPRDMVKQTTAFRDLPLRVAAYPSRGSGDNLNIFIMAEPIDPSTKLTAGSAAIADKANKATTVSLDEKQLAGRPITASLSGPPGTYRVRFAATDASGRSGAVDYTVNAELTPAGPLRMSGLVVAALREKSMAPTMQFKDEAAAVGYLEIYGQLTGQVSARMEVATQQVYLTTFLQPVLAEDALYPKRLWIIAAITAICLALWGLGAGIAVLMRNYAACGGRG